MYLITRIYALFSLLLLLFLEMPKFAEPITNVTVPIGREATLVCIVDDLGSYKVSHA